MTSHLLYLLSEAHEYISISSTTLHIIIRDYMVVLITVAWNISWNSHFHEYSNYFFPFVWNQDLQKEL